MIRESQRLWDPADPAFRANPYPFYDRLRTEAPIFVRRDVLERAKAVDLATQASDEEKLKEWLEELNPDDLGKYTM